MAWAIVRLQFSLSVVNILSESSKVAFISNSFVSIEALGIAISGLKLGSISIKSSFFAFSFNEYGFKLLCFFFTLVKFK